MIKLQDGCNKNCCSHSWSKPSTHFCVDQYSYVEFKKKIIADLNGECCVLAMDRRFIGSSCAVLDLRGSIFGLVNLTSFYEVFLSSKKYNFLNDVVTLEMIYVSWVKEFLDGISVTGNVLEGKKKTVGIRFYNAKVDLLFRMCKKWSVRRIFSLIGR